MDFSQLGTTAKKTALLQKIVRFSQVVETFGLCAVDIELSFN